jgi:hypothetical protein
VDPKGILGSRSETIENHPHCASIEGRQSLARKLRALDDVVKCWDVIQGVKRLDGEAKARGPALANLRGWKWWSAQCLPDMVLAALV